MANCTKEHSWMLVEKYWEREWEKIKQIDFPKTREFEITDKECISEVKNHMSKNNGWKTPSKLVVKFHPSMRYANRKGCLSPYNYWQKIKEDSELFKKFYENRLRCSDWFNEKQGANFHYLDEGFVPEFIYGIGMSTSRKAPFVSYFKPALAKYIILKYLNEFKTIFDPCSGYSGRMLGALYANKNYFGLDINSTTIEESKNIVEFLNKHFSGSGLCKQSFKDVTLMCRDSLDTTGEGECLFTCTPYADIEEWMDEDEKITSYLSCDDWIDRLTANFKCERYVFVVDDTVQKYRKYVVEELENTSHFGKNKEYILVI